MSHSFSVYRESYPKFRWSFYTARWSEEDMEKAEMEDALEQHEQRLAAMRQARYSFETLKKVCCCKQPWPMTGFFGPGNDQQNHIWTDLDLANLHILNMLEDFWAAD